MMKGIGYWDAFAWGSLFTIVFLLAYLLIRGSKNERETDEFLCGESYEYKTPVHEFFFGFEKSLERLFRANMRFHSEIINEYVAWLLVFAALCSILFIILFIIGVKKL